MLVFPLVLIFGESTPSNLVVAIYAMIAAAAAYKALRHTGTSELPSAFLAVFIVWGSNMMWMSTVGGVWFIAAGANLMLLMLSVLCAVKNRRCAAFALAALAVGCRPLSLVYFLALMAYFAVADKDKGGLLRRLLSQWKYLVIPAAIGAAYMVYNYMRFDDPLVFGHKYLPEFANEAQFGFQYLGTNLRNIFLRPVTVNANGTLSYPIFDGFLFYVANPIFFVLGVRVVCDIIKKRMDAVRITTLAALAANLFMLCLHRTFGVWQFGARFLVDMVAFTVFYLIYRGWRPKKWEYFAGCFAILFNVYGAFAMHFLYA